MLTRCSIILKNLLVKKETGLFLWFIPPMVAFMISTTLHLSHYNNYLIFKQVFWHLAEQKNLYALYPGEYADINHYGPLFSILIMPFALLPLKPGIFLWVAANVILLYYAIRQLPIGETPKRLVVVISSIEMLTSVQNYQFNPMLSAWILLAFVLVKKEYYFFAAALVVAGTFIKLYGIVGLLFFFFCRDRLRYTVYLLLWGLLLFWLPALLCGSDFLLHSYTDWYYSLIEKNALNIKRNQINGMQDISLMGLCRRLLNRPFIPSLYFLIPGFVLTALPLLRRRLYHHPGYQLAYLSQVMIGVVIFSTGAESSTYIIAVIGFAIWYTLSDLRVRSFGIILLLLVMVLTILSPTDLFPRAIRNAYVLKYALKALPCVVAWGVITAELLFYPYGKTPSPPDTSIAALL